MWPVGEGHTRTTGVWETMAERLRSQVPESDGPEFQSWLLVQVAVWPRAGHMAFLHLHFLICTMWVIEVNLRAGLNLARRY